MSVKELIGTIAETVLKILLVAVAIVLVYRFSVQAYNYGYRVFGEPAVSEEPGVAMRVTISGDDTAAQIGQALEDAGLIRDAGLFRIVEKLSGRTLQPGSYELTTAMTIEEMIDVMSQEAEETEQE